MKPTNFEYRRPGTLDEALKWLAQYGMDAKILAGGQSLVPMMNFRLARPDVLIDINALGELDYHRRDGDSLRIGALTRHATLMESALVRETCPLMSEAYHYVAHGTVRNRGTLCGNLCHADPASEMPAVMLAVGATLVVRSARGERKVAAADFFQGLYATAVAPDEILVEVQIPLRGASTGHAFEEISARQGDFAMTLVAALLDVRGGRIQQAALAYAGVSDRAQRLDTVEQALVGQSPVPEVFERAAKLASEGFDLVDDVHADRQYRQDLLRTLTYRALSTAAGRAQGNA
jgi:CO/xanthine dehydrogenase FAD-binding subunit